MVPSNRSRSSPTNPALASKRAASVRSGPPLSRGIVKGAIDACRGASSAKPHDETRLDVCWLGNPFPDPVFGLGRILAMDRRWGRSLAAELWFLGLGRRLWITGRRPFPPAARHRNHGCPRVRLRTFLGRADRRPRLDCLRLPCLRHLPGTRPIRRRSSRWGQGSRSRRATL